LGGDVQVHLCTDFDEIPFRIKNLEFHLIVCNLGVLDEGKIGLVARARELGFHGPILMLAKIPTQALVKKVADLVAVVHLEKPFENKDLQGVCMKFLSEIDVGQRTYRRYYTNQKAEVALDGTQSHVASRVFNMSKGGAYFEGSEIGAYKVGDVVSMRIRLQEVSREYKVSGKIVWTTPKGIWTGNYGVGVEFLHADHMSQAIVFKS
jgi:Tfp pilus assembly protein PilZ